MDFAFPITLADMRAELAREAAAREQVYAKLVQSGRLSQDKVDWRARVLAALGQAIDELERLNGWPPGRKQDNPT